MPASVAVSCRLLSPSREAKKIRKEKVIGRIIGKLYEKIRSSLRLWTDNSKNGRQRSKATCWTKEVHASDEEGNADLLSIIVVVVPPATS